MARKMECIAMLLAGGQGSRLGILTKNIAKPAVPYGVYYQRRNDHPVLRQFLTLLARNGRPEIFTSD